MAPMAGFIPLGAPSGRAVAPAIDQDVAVPIRLAKQQNTPPVLPDESSPLYKNIPLSVNRKKAYIHTVPPA